MSNESMQLAIQFRSIGDGTVRRAARYCRDLEVSRLVLPWASVPGYPEGGVMDAEALAAMRREMAAEGVTFGTMVMRPAPGMIKDTPEADVHWRQVEENLRIMAAEGGETLILFVTNDRPPDEAQVEDAWNNLFAFYRRLTGLAEAAGVRLALHPVARTEDRPRRDLVHDYASMQRLIDAVPGPANGVCICVGNLWLSAGDEIYDQIRALGDRIYAVHVRATRRGLGETPFWLDDADGPDYRQVMQALRDIDYRGELIPEHLPSVTVENRHDVGTAWVVGYMRAAMGLF